jgi:hypothetical protein
MQQPALQKSRLMPLSILYGCGKCEKKGYRNRSLVVLDTAGLLIN